MFSCAIIENKTKNKTNKQTNKQKPNKYNQALYTNYVSSILPGKIEGEESRFDISFFEDTYSFHSFLFDCGPSVMYA